MSAALLPSIFDTIKLFILNTLLLDPEFVIMSVATVDTLATAVFPMIVVTLTIFGAAIYFSYPKTIAIAIALPVVKLTGAFAQYAAEPLEESICPDVPKVPLANIPAAAFKTKSPAEPILIFPVAVIVAVLIDEVFIDAELTVPV